jgi:hypothetical protein
VGSRARKRKRETNERRRKANGEREGRERLDLVALRATQGGKGDALERGEI